MTECKVTEQSRNFPETETVTEKLYPTHSVVQSVIMDNVKPFSAEKHPPNGMTHISSDANGLINPKKMLHTEIPGAVSDDAVINCCSPGLRGVCNSTEEDQHECHCDKTNDEDIHHISTELRSVALYENELQARDVLYGIDYVVYESELQMPDIMRLITKDLSEPYSIYTYRYFIHNWPKLCFLAMDAGKCVGAVVCKLDLHKKMVRRGYIAMLAVDSDYRRRKIGSHLVLKAIKAMIADDCDEVVLETEITNQAALRLYENLGFVRDKRLFRYYLNGVDALRLKLWLR